MSSTSSGHRAAATVLLVLVAACARTSAATIETTLPVSPGQAWDDARAALARLDPHLQDATSSKGRAATAKAEVVLGGIRFGEVMITGRTDLPRVRAVSLAAPPRGEGCDKIRGDLLKALGSGWNEGETRLGAVTATSDGRVARIVCNGAELSVTIAG